MENNFQFSSAAVSDRGLSEKRLQNEDSYLVLKNHGLFVVADGVGGAQAGDVASQMAVEILGEAFSNMKPGSDAEDVMKIGIERANAAIYQMSQELPQFSTMATTIVGLHLDGNIATIGHVGDSRLYRLDGSGNLYRETQDHSIVEEEVRAGRMTVAQAANHPSRNVISRAVGAEPTVEVDMKTIMVEPNTSFLLCTDGVTRHVNDFEIRELLVSNSEQENVCRQIKNLCYQRGAEDNLTAVIVRISNEVASFQPIYQPVSASDFEESTIVPARPAIVPAPQAHQKQNEIEDYPTQELPQPPIFQQQPPPSESFSANKAQIIETVEDDSDETEPHIPLRPIEPKVADASANVSPAPVNRSNSSIFERDEKQYRIGDENGESSFGRVLSSLLFLLIGGLLGAGIYYLFAQNVTPPPPPAPQITEMQTPNIPFSAFEENRRNVDKNPQQFIQANAGSPQDAIDYYLLGRAYLLTSKYPEAKQSFNEAKNRLAQVDETNSRTLANEIAMSLAIINNVFAQSAFEKDIQANIPSANMPTNTNPSASANRQN